MRYRKLTPGLSDGLGFGDYTFGRGNENFFTDTPEAVGQAVLTRLKLETGQWFLDLDDGTPWMTKVLGKYTGDTRDPVIRSRTVQTAGVESIVHYSSSLDRETRGYAVSITLDTIFGLIQMQKVTF